MSGLSDYLAKKLVDHSTGRTAAGTLPTPFLALMTTAPTDANTGGVEVTGGSYARKAVAATDFGAASGSAPSSAVTGVDEVFVTATADWAPIATPAVAVAAYDASSAGNLLWWDWLGSASYQPFSTTDTAGHTIQCPAHGFAAGDPVVFTTEFGGTIPTGLSVATIYYVIAAGLTSDVFEVSTTVGGSAVAFTVKGNGMVRKVAVQTILNGATVKFSSGNLTVAMA